ncbi:MAG: hypothetical protein ABEJ81_01000 [Haloferacaceae archaeon]
MRVPVPTNRLVAFTLAGAVLTGIVAVGLAMPGFGLTSADETPQAGDAGASGVAADAPTPNQNFTPAVASSGGGGEREHHEEEGEADEHEDEEHERE